MPAAPTITPRRTGRYRRVPLFLWTGGPVGLTSACRREQRYRPAAGSVPERGPDGPCPAPAPARYPTECRSDAIVIIRQPVFTADAGHDDHGWPAPPRPGFVTHR
jgi:hypothetical protein